MAALAAGHAGVSQIDILDEEVLELITTSPLDLQQAVASWVEASGVTIREMRSPDESLENLFDALLRIHRGEAS